ncbi:hypothetical protein M9H77_28280 [Catharanthus roseus]|uniref:Uncharacterized protein n=1 Tax=Catharanthus roseus TaxID=4058 RepID=A0ACC0AEV4_CATRO|nr:hypothetical protein M9H77_28280 [Catharanthus roseus]
MPNIYIARSGLYHSYQKPSQWQIFEHTMLLVSIARLKQYLYFLNDVRHRRTLTPLHPYMYGVDMFVPVWKRRYRRASTACSTTKLSASAPLNSTSTSIQYVLQGMATRRLNKERLLDIVL